MRYKTHFPTVILQNRIRIVVSIIVLNGNVI
jgi:hypothetical protein